MTISAGISEYVSKLEAAPSDVCQALNQLITSALPEANGKVWHGHPVWFLGDNPVVGYSLKKSGIQVLFWSGQSFETPGLKALGQFKAASIDVPSSESLAQLPFDAWLSEAKVVQWDYANLPKKRTLEKLTDF